MSYNYTLKYRTFDQLLDEVFVDFQNYNLQNMIEPHQLIKVAKRVNYDLGLRIFMTKQAVLEVEKGKAKLPDDFFVLNFALVCDEYEVHEAMPQGTWIEDRPLITPYKSTPASVDFCAAPTVNCSKCSPQPCGCNGAPLPSSAYASEATYNPTEPYGNYCNKPRVYLNCKGEAYELVQIVNTQSRIYKRLFPIKIVNNAANVDCDCPNLNFYAPDTAWIKDNFIYTSFDCGSLYINYQGMLEDDGGNLLVPDHDMLNEYYEYALKQRILENLIMNDEITAGQKLQLIENRYRAARNQALSIVNTPNFAEMKQLWELNRTAQYSKYYDMFKSLPYGRPRYGLNPGPTIPRLG
jgi:hypothetical protein